MVGLTAISDGYSTWGIISGYDACFYGAKAFCYLLGIVSLGRDSKMVIDIFVPRKYKSGRKQFAEAYDILVAHRLEERLTHNMLWKIMNRLCNTLVLPNEVNDIRKNLRSINYDKMSNYRNRLMYDGGFWFNYDRFADCDLHQRISDLGMYRAIGEPADEPQDAEKYFSLARNIQDILVYFLSDIASLAPAISKEADALREWRARAG